MIQAKGAGVRQELACLANYVHTRDTASGVDGGVLVRVPSPPRRRCLTGEQACSG